MKKLSKVITTCIALMSIFNLAQSQNSYTQISNLPSSDVPINQASLTDKEETMDKELVPIKSGVYKWSEQKVKQGDLRESRTFLEGISPHFEYIRIHSTTQFPGAAPSTAHANAEHEECIIVKEGEMKVTIEGESKVLGPGGVILLMPQQHHSLQNIGDTKLTYYVMKYKSKKKMNIERGLKSGGTMVIHADSLAFRRSVRGAGKSYFDRSTAMCERFEMHITRLNDKGPSHKPHKHIESEIILMLSGNTEMTIDDKVFTATAGDFYYVNSQLLHGVRNSENKPCSYFAFKWN